MSDLNYRVIGRQEVAGHPDLIRVLFAEKEDVVIRVSDFLNYKIHINALISTEQYRSLVQCSAVVQALTLAIRYLNFNLRTTSEVEQYLKRKGVVPEHIDAVISQLKQSSALDDVRYASLYISSKKEIMSRKMMIHRLQLRGVPMDVIHHVLGQICHEDSEFESALKAVQKYRRQKGAPQTHMEIMKMAASMARKGFSQSVIYKIINNMDNDVE